jgi:hypothetical protein
VLKGAHRRVVHHALKLGTVDEQRAGDAVIDIDVRITDGPSLRRDKGPRAAPPTGKPPSEGNRPSPGCCYDG